MEKVKTDILEVLKVAYTMALEAQLPGLSTTLKEFGLFESGLLYWFDSICLEALELDSE